MVENPLTNRRVERPASSVGGAARVGVRVRGTVCGLGVLLVVGLACSAPIRDRDRTRVVTAAAPSGAERYCAWYGAVHAGTLYFGMAAFWSANAVHRHPTGDLREPGPQPIGRFDLATERMRAPLEVGTPGARSGVWDVLALDGAVYFTTYFESAGRVDPQSGEVSRFAGLGLGLNELARGPDGSVLVSRYGAGPGGNGSVLAFSPAGEALEEWPLTAASGYRVAPKTVAWDARRRRIWATADLLRVDGGPPRFPSYVIEPRRGATGRIDRPEIQFVAFAEDGTGYRAVLDGSLLRLIIVPPPGSGRRLLPVTLDRAFPSGLDFAQDIQVAADGRVVVTRWSGRVHVVDADGTARSVQLPRLDPEGLYYTAVLHGGRLCATHCADVTVVCVDAP
jgi:hypothetical protein